MLMSPFFDAAQEFKRIGHFTKIERNPIQPKKCAWKANFCDFVETLHICFGSLTFCCYLNGIRIASCVLMKLKSVMVILSFLMSLCVQATTLDDVIGTIVDNTHHNPFVIGKTKSSGHPQYSDLMDFAQKYKTTIKWVPSVAKEVLRLPFNSDRMAVKPNDKFDGWFDEFVSPNQVIMSNKAAFIILIHELRHVVHLGSHGLIEGTWFDRLLQTNKQLITQFHKKLAQSKLSALKQLELKTKSTRLIETASEISAHQGDVVLAKSFGDEEVAEAYLEFIEDYKAEFSQAFKALKKHPFSRDESFLNDIDDGLKKLILEKK